MKHRTFHHDRHELHGITVVVDIGDRVWVGRCDNINDAAVILLDADVHEDGADGTSKQDWVLQAARFGIWKRHDRVEVPLDAVVSVTRLGEIAVD